MAKLKLHYDGWLALPAGLCQKLGVKTGDRLEAELVDGAVLLRPASKTGRQAQSNAKAIENATANPGTTPSVSDKAEPAKRGPGRPRKHTIDEATPVAKAIKARGRPRSTPITPDSDPVARRVTAVGPAKLIKKADLASAAAPIPEPMLAKPVLKQTRGDDRSFVERRPFRHVEVRKLDAGRAHSRARQPSKPSIQAG